MGPQIGVYLWSSKLRNYLVDWEIHQFLKRFHRNLHIFEAIIDLHILKAINIRDRTIYLLYFSSYMKFITLIEYSNKIF